ncbi:MAG: hypothetical protein H9W81_13790 [Enterococcus sp.]|nr:hypothetical protein [Enterococcus sp.]
MDIVAKHGITDQFLYHVTGYSELLIRDAREGNIVFLGHTLRRVELLAETCEKMSMDSTVLLSPADFLEKTILTFSIDGENVDGVVGILVANGDISPAEAVEAAHGLKDVPSPPPLYQKPAKELRWPKAGIRQVW